MRMNECKTLIIYFTVCNRSFRQRPVRQRMKSIRQRRMSVRRRLYMYMPVTSGPNIQNTFSFASAVGERTRNKLYGAWMTERGISCMALSSGYTYLAVC